MATIIDQVLSLNRALDRARRLAGQVKISTSAPGATGVKGGLDPVELRRWGV